MSIDWGVRSGWGSPAGWFWESTQARRGLVRPRWQQCGGENGQDPGCILRPELPRCADHLEKGLRDRVRVKDDSKVSVWSN